ncbi:tautomerase family protein [Kordiimonas aestuarii]|uniref:tautomerase family protein n=1 Tax=Kordiimonas aestuarii TaxID=1005925 RepID=UPI0021D3AFB1|nr:tautomerase family protein [Kordiimonas aestuarii]
MLRVTRDIIKGVFTPSPEERLVEKVTEAMISVEGQALRPVLWVGIMEVQQCNWGIGGQLLKAADVHPLAENCRRNAGQRALKLVT